MFKKGLSVNRMYAKAFSIALKHMETITVTKKLGCLNHVIFYTSVNDGGLNIIK